MFSDLSWGVAIIGGIFFAAGLGLEELGKYLSRYTKTRLAQVLLVWPCIGLGYAFMGIAALMIVWNIFDPIIMWLWSLINSN
jgi:hypothetical protein